jgi:hypothetical protein
MKTLIAIGALLAAFAAPSAHAEIVPLEQQKLCMDEAKAADDRLNAAAKSDDNFPH